ncbi:hypothetical protein BCY91_07380 [Pelobium manganitolerans]|uniref:DUF4256 domain-containing protein n=1 Tax=Pelobium manganitolerans TaxID=1842495 RepID=A0A419S3V0_9SPHI|nr:DUF4256 domain-containing protein [Pelobium manganitolerans]RKD14302.1 hypothetical protein BCY91_07380 [Pelobium manganitolerans]
MEKSELFSVLKTRFEQNMHRHKGLAWADVFRKLNKNGKTVSVLLKMEQSGGEPDVLGADDKQGFLFCDCAKESPKERRSFCYDADALASRKEHKPKNDALSAAAEIGAELMDEALYYKLQLVESVDLKTSSWVKTPDEVRRLGGAIFCDRRYNRVFTYHNGAESYYASRGFRTFLWL